MIISFNADALAAAKQKLPDLKHYYLSSLKQDKQTRQWSPGVDEIIATAKRIGADGVDVQSSWVMSFAHLIVLVGRGGSAADRRHDVSGLDRNP